MPITINFAPATEKKLQLQAAASGKDVETLVKEAVEARLVLSALSFREILAPIHEDFRKNGMSEQELDSLIQEARADARAAKTSNGQV